MKIVLATKNEGKVREIAQMMKGTGVELVSLNHFEALPEIVEDGATYLENALKKARTVSEYLGETVLADDSGLRVDALKGEPGVYSARYAGENATDEENNAKLLGKLKEVPTEKRTASFFCALVLYRPEGIYHSFEAEWRGRIIDEGRGTNGFGYDPIFLDPRLGKTAAELPPEIKNRVSHRGQAFAKFKAWLEAGRLE
ncbi:MAG TPA: XTP/dITP diphosphatase [Smithellaceae bacterium]|nr:XTP/dITP diphosphatase [Smithellaceae bacterium]